MTLRFENLSFAYPGSAPLIRNASGEAKPGEITVVIGPNGAGKSTLLRLASGLLSPTSGRVRIDADEAHSMSASGRASKLAYVPQRPSVALGFSARAVAAFGSRTGDAKAVDRALESLGLASQADQPFGTLSAGQQQRTALARALARCEPTTKVGTDGAGVRAIVADEPTSAQDPRWVQRLGTAFQKLASQGLAVLIATHDLVFAQRLATATILLNAHGEASFVRGVPAREDLESLFEVRFEPAAGDESGLLLPTRASPTSETSSG